MSRDPVKFIFIAGPCVLESLALGREIAGSIQEQLRAALGPDWNQQVDWYFKASFDKANRTSVASYRGPGMKLGLEWLSQIRQEFGVPVLTDVHEPAQAEPVAHVVDALQVPAFLCRQTDLIAACALAASRYGRALNLKKGQFLAPEDTAQMVDKCWQAVEGACGGNPRPRVWLTERGTTFGYGQLVVDMTTFVRMKKVAHVPVIFDATHSVQRPGAGPGGKSTGGNREFIEPLSFSAIAAGAEGVFMEVHPRPDEALSDGPNAYPLEKVGAWVTQALRLRRAANCAS